MMNRACCSIFMELLLSQFDCHEQCMLGNGRHQRRGKPKTEYEAESSVEAPS